MDLGATIQNVIKQNKQTISQIGSDSINNPLNNPNEMLTNLWALSLYSTRFSFMSSVIKLYRDTVGGIIAKI